MAYVASDRDWSTALALIVVERMEARGQGVGVASKREQMLVFKRPNQGPAGFTREHVVTLAQASSGEQDAVDGSGGGRGLDRGERGTDHRERGCERVRIAGRIKAQGILDRSLGEGFKLGGRGYRRVGKVC